MNWFECVPNFSEGRDPERIERIVAAGREVPGVTVLDVERNADHHRSVVSLVGEAEPLLESVFRMVRAATDLIDLTHHQGEHPRMGATDVVPFVPLGSATMEEASALAVRLGERVWRELSIPVYLYAHTARRPERQDLAKVREGQFEGLREAVPSDPTRAPDIGAPRLHPTAGAVAIGARPVLIAFNAYLTTPDVAIAKRVARAVRARDGGLAEVKALGFDIRERARAQVSMNLTDYRKTPIHRALEAVRREAARYGAGVEESEVVGLVPEDALFDAAEFYLQLNRFERSAILERKVRAARGETTQDSVPTADSLAGFAARLAARTPTPGGGSAAAAAGALGAALGEMVIAYSRGADDAELDTAGALLRRARERLLVLVEEDARAYERVRESRKAGRAAPSDASAQAAWTAALEGAARVPLETARLGREAADRLRAVEGRVKATIRSDWVTAQALLEAAVTGAAANVAINLEDLRARSVPTADIETELERLRAPA